MDTAKIALCALAAPFIISNSAQAGEKPLVRLEIDEPGDKSGANPNRNQKAAHKRVVMNEDGWVMSFRLQGRYAEDLVSTRRSTNDSGPNFETLVLDNPDGCLDLSHAVPTQANFGGFWSIGPFEANCPGGQDESFLIFNVDYQDVPGTQDEYVEGGCEGFKRERLIDDTWDEIKDGIVDYRDSNKPYVVKDPTSQFATGSAVGPFTGGSESTFNPDSKTHLDCYGYGIDEDLSSLVVMVNQGGARIFDGDLNYDNTRIRNMAGLISGVTYELVDDKRWPAVVAHMPIRREVLTPLTFFDINSDIFFGTSFPEPVVIKRKIEDGPIEAFELSGVTSPEQIIDKVIELTPNDFKVRVRAVVVEGDAPEFIDDLNADGKFTAEDLELAGYKLLSNEDKRAIRIVTRPSITEEEDPFECPDFDAVDLDGDGVFGFCDDGDGTSRSKTRVPR